jgi:hypothetical protein
VTRHSILIAAFSLRKSDLGSESRPVSCMVGDNPGIHRCRMFLIFFTKFIGGFFVEFLILDVGKYSISRLVRCLRPDNWQGSNLFVLVGLSKRIPFGWNCLNCGCKQRLLLPVFLKKQQPGWFLLLSLCPRELRQSQACVEWGPILGGLTKHWTSCLTQLPKYFSQSTIEVRI